MEGPSNSTTVNPLVIPLDVGIACENEILRYGLRAALNDLDTVRRVQEIPAGADFDAAVLRSVGIVIVSYAEWDTAQRVVPAARAANVRVLAFVDDVTAKDIEKLLSLRPDGFILQRELNQHVLEDALIRVARSETPMPSQIVAELFDSADRMLRRGTHPRYVELSAREREALQLLADGLSNKEIAQRLYISVHGAKRLVGNILLKLNCPNRTQAAVIAMRHGLVRDRT